MAITLAQVKKALDSDGVKYMESDATTLLIGFSRSGQSKLTVVLSLRENGEYLDLRTLRMATCTAENPNLERVQADLLRQNLEYKLTKFSWDPDDGEIVATTSLPIEDNQSLGNDQMTALMAGLVGRCAESLPEIEKLIGGQPAAPRKSSRPDTTARDQGARQLAAESPSVPPSASGPAKSGAQSALAAGVLLLGLAAILAVVYLFIHK